MTNNGILETVKVSPHKNLQLELLKKLLNDEIRSLSRRNVVQSRSALDSRPVTEPHYHD